jgi:hypothetical protein
MGNFKKNEQPNFNVSIRKDKNDSSKKGNTDNILKGIYKSPLEDKKSNNIGLSTLPSINVQP